MDTIFLGFVVFLFLLAIFDLWVGVSNDAVNFLNSAKLPDLEQLSLLPP